MSQKPPAAFPERGERSSPVRQEEDRVRGVLVFVIIMAATLFAVLCVFVMWLLWRANSLAYNPDAFRKVQEATVRPGAIGGVNHTLIDVDTSTQRLNRERRLHLQRSRWIDRGAGVAQIPIDEAMRALVVGTAAALDAIAGAAPPAGDSAPGGPAGEVGR